MSKTAELTKDAVRMPTIDAGVRIGHVHLKVADLQRALEAKAARPPPRGPPVFTIPPFSTRTGGCWPTHCAG
jgi:hypothetical protein